MLPPGTELQHRYRLEHLSGQGGMGAVYQATDLRLGSAVAVKQIVGDADLLSAAFEREARLLARLRHPVLPKVIDHFVDEAGQFLVMEFIPGDDLATLLLRRNAPFETADVLRWADQLLDALAYLHAQQPPVLHRDIKPHNLKLTPEGDIVLLDFGLAKGTTGQTTIHSHLLGYTLSYAPLEQLRGESSEPRSDLYALAATLYDLLTATKPPDALQRVTAVMDGQPDPLRPANEVNPLTPAPVAAVLRHALALRPSQRPADATAMRQALQAASSWPKTLVMAAEPAVEYAGVWRRFAAAFIDLVLLTFVSFGVGALYGVIYTVSTGSPSGVEIGAQILGILLNWVYFAAMESSVRQATLGKMALGIMVTDLSGGRLSFGRASGRHAGKFLSWLTLGVGFLIMGFTAQRQALHDIIAECLVVVRK